ncbi:MAG: carbohydrate ABC transporter permease [Chloroflexi bacterium]|nr:carbohydrate ABC transporter permease [Chloroflexota bacterium]MCL5110263.1 carbohydrate ABC transporter permease [Chloroflexota bacterium]
MSESTGVLLTHRTRPLSRKVRKVSLKVLFYISLALISVPVLFVFYWMVLTSFKDGTQATAFPPLFLFQATLKNYQDVIGKTPLLTYVFNSLVVALGATGLGLVLGLPAAYSVAKFSQGKLAIVVLIARMAPGVSYLIPWFILFSRIGLVDTYAALILTHLILTLPMTMWIMIPFFEDLPHEIEEAALIDGCTWYGIFWRVAVPLTVPGIVASAILSIIFSWNNFAFALILGGDRTRTVPVAVFSFMTFEGVNWGGVAAAATLICVPVILLALVIQRYLVAGLTLGSIKG